MNEINKERILAECHLLAKMAGIPADGHLGCLAFPVLGDVINLENEQDIPVWNFADGTQLQSPCEFNGYKWSICHKEVVDEATGETGLVFHKNYDNVLIALASALTHMVAVQFTDAGEELGLA